MRALNAIFKNLNRTLLNVDFKIFNISGPVSHEQYHEA